jgi:Predicted membrane protein
MTVKKLPSDLFIIMGLVLLTDIFVLTPGINETMFRNILGLPLVLFLPGYALIAALFPAKYDLDGIERAALSFGLSIAVVPLIGLGLNYTPWGIRTLPILISLSAFTFIMCGLAYLRRASLPESEAFDISFKAAALSLKAEVMETSESRLDRALTVFLIISILLSIATLAYVVVSPKEGEHFTEFYLLGPEGKADNYTTNYTLGQSGTVIVGVVNHEYRPVNYTMEVTLENKSLFLPENVKHINLAHNETWKEPVTIMPPLEGKNLKLQFLLFNDTEKSVPYRDLHLWVNVSAPKQLKT